MLGLKSSSGSDVTVCHVNKGNETIPISNSYLVFGKIIQVSEKSYPSHLAHGDSVKFSPVDDQQRIEFEQLYKVRLANADCVFMSSSTTTRINAAK
jgi:hypothetical protein